MHTLRKIKNLATHCLLPPMLALGLLAALNSSAQAACFGYPESTSGCIVNGVNGPCVGKSGADIISTRNCINPPSTDLENTSTCVISGLGGNDVILALNNGNPNFICGGGGNDLILGNSDNDVILGEAGADILLGGGGTNLVFGGTENDILLLGPGGGFSSANNYNYGGAGRDLCQAGRSGVNVKPECEVRLPY
jgi:Ca2+-binding RTX toxin-like protein